MQKLRSRLGNLASPGMLLGMLALCVAMSGTALAAATIGSDDVVNDSLKGIDIKNKSLTKKDFRGSVRGPRGLRGVRGPAGPTASAASEANPEPDTAIPNATPFVDLVTTNVTTSESSRIIGTGTIMVNPTTDAPDVECRIEIDGDAAGLPLKERLTDFEVIAVTAGAVRPAGAHTVSISCRVTGGGGNPLDPPDTADFTQGNVTAVAAGS